MLSAFARHPFRFLTLGGFLSVGLLVWTLPPQAGVRAAGKTPAKVQASPAQAEPKLSYPVTKTVEHVDEYHGEKVKDPYRWLESLDSEETRQWVEAQNKVTFGYLEKIPGRDKIKQRLTELWNFEKYSAPFKEGGRYFYSYNTGLQNQSALYTMSALDGAPQLLLDPNTLAKDGTVALAGMSVSHDGNLMAYGLSAAGSDWQEWRVRDVQTGKDLPDLIKWIKFSNAAWTRDNKGFFYGRFDEPKNTGKSLEDVNFFHKLYYHRLGTPQAQDTLVYEDKTHKEWQFVPTVSDDGKFLIITVAKGTDDKYRILYQELDKPGAKIVELISNFDGEYTFIDNDGPVLFFKTDLKAPKAKVIAIDVRKPAERRELIPESSDTLQHVSLVNNLFVATYLHDATTLVKVFDLTGKPLRDVVLPGLGTSMGFGGRRGYKETFFAFTSYNTPPIIYRLDLTSFESKIWKQPQLKFSPQDFETKQVFFPSKDGTRIPMFLTARKGMAQNGQTPTYLYGYGGFNVPILPGFSVADLVWMEHGGLIAYVNLRGGGEYGEDWHRAGTKLRKQNVFDDFIGAAEWLIKNKYTSTPKLSIAGGSNGGLLVGAAITQRPDLFGAAIPAVGVMDMLRFHKFTIGWEWIDDYGSSDNAEEFKALRAYSPYHNLKAGTSYPATMVTTADHDDRVVPGHSFKFAAALQAAQKGPAPTLIRIDVRAGHGAGKPTSKRIDEATDRLAFLGKALGIDFTK
jgi:prolyl oligopeptidase